LDIEAGKAMSDIEKLVILPNADGTRKTMVHQDVTALFSNLSVSPGQYQHFSRHKHTGATSEEALIPIELGSIPQECARIGIFSPMGGSGSSTMTVSVGSILCGLGRKILLVDTSAWTTLIFHFGATESRPGQRTFSPPGSPNFKIAMVDACLLGDIENIVNNPFDGVIFDLGGMSIENLTVLVTRIDVLLVPLLADPSTLRLAISVVKFLDKLGSSAPPVKFVLNKMDDSPAAKNIQRLLSLALDDRLFASAIRYQTEVPDALANGVVLPFYAPDAQATSVCQEIVDWLDFPAKNTRKNALQWREE
jgi:MinD-like ATPase involved in chromosome partitioning or flagellar assembly